MAEQLNSGEVLAQIPEGMSLMSQQDLAKIYRGEVGASSTWGVQSKENHTYIVLAWQKSSRLLRKLAGLKQRRDNNEKQSAPMMGGYESLGHTEHVVDGHSAYGYRYLYTVQGQRQIGENVLFDGKSCSYTLLAVCKENCKGFMDKKLQEILASLVVQS